MGEDDQPIAIAALALADHDRAALVDLLRRHGRRHPTVIPGRSTASPTPRPLPPAAEVHKVVNSTEPAAGNELPPPAE